MAEFRKSNAINRYKETSNFSKHYILCRKKMISLLYRILKCKNIQTWRAKINFVSETLNKNPIVREFANNVILHYSGFTQKCKEETCSGCLFHRFSRVVKGHVKQTHHGYILHILISLVEDIPFSNHGRQRK